MVQTLQQAGFEAYLVGGCVRDSLLGRVPKDFDVATNATPEQVKRQFRNCRLIGKRFLLAHVIFGRELIEVATFRATDHSGKNTQKGRLLRDNVYGSLKDDVFRRDLRINALYYDPSRDLILDMVGALEDIRAKRLRMLGDAATRYREDPVRMLRVARFAAKFGFEVDAQSRAPMLELGHLLEDIPPARLYDEVIKLFQTGHGLASLNSLLEFDLLRYLLPMTFGCLHSDNQKLWLHFLQQVLINTDERIKEGKSVSPTFLYAAFLWLPVREYLLEAGSCTLAAGAPPVAHIQHGASEVLRRQIAYTAIPRRITNQMRDIWTLQPRLEKYQGRRAQRQLGHPAFRAGYDFLLLREQAGELATPISPMWTQLQIDHSEALGSGAPDYHQDRPTTRRRRRRRG